jgi:hypothetical protein
MMGTPICPPAIIGGLEVMRLIRDRGAGGAPRDTIYKNGFFMPG